MNAHSFEQCIMQLTDTTFNSRIRMWLVGAPKLTIVQTLSLQKYDYARNFNAWKMIHARRHELLGIQANHIQVRNAQGYRQTSHIICTGGTIDVLTFKTADTDGVNWFCGNFAQNTARTQNILDIWCYHQKKTNPSIRQYKRNLLVQVGVIKSSLFRQQGANLAWMDIWQINMR